MSVLKRLSGEQVLVRVFIGESDKWYGRPLYMALIERLRQEGFAGATIVHGIAGFGARSLLHTSHLLRLSEDLPVLIEIVEKEAELDRLKSILEGMLTKGLVTVDRVQAFHFVGDTDEALR